MGCGCSTCMMHLLHSFIHCTDRFYHRPFVVAARKHDSGNPLRCGIILPKEPIKRGPRMTEEFARSLKEREAFITRASSCVVFLQTLSPDNNPSVGTGVLLMYGERLYIMSALHVFKFDDGDLKRAQRASRFKFGCGPSLSILKAGDTAPHATPLDFGVPLPLESQPLVDSKYDLIALRLEDGFETPEFASALEVETGLHRGELQKGDSLLTLGDPWAGRQKLPNGGEALMPYVDHVKYDPDIDSSRLPHWYSQEDHFLFPYDLSSVGIEPNGFSGAPVWKHEESKKMIWAANPKLVGIVLSFAKERSVIIAVKASRLLPLLAAQ